MIFDAMDRYMVTLVLPMLRNTAAPELYTASAGYEYAEILRYVMQASITSLSTLPNSRVSMFSLPTSTSAAISTANAVENDISWLAASPASSAARFPMYWLITTAPPEASAVNR